MSVCQGQTGLHRARRQICNISLLWFQLWAIVYNETHSVLRQAYTVNKPQMSSKQGSLKLQVTGYNPYSLTWIQQCTWDWTVQTAMHLVVVVVVVRRRRRRRTRLSGYCWDVSQLQCLLWSSHPLARTERTSTARPFHWEVLLGALAGDVRKWKSKMIFKKYISDL